MYGTEELCKNLGQDSGGSSPKNKGGRIQYFVTMVNLNKHRKKINIHIM